MPHYNKQYKRALSSFVCTRKLKLFIFYFSIFWLLLIKIALLRNLLSISLQQGTVKVINEFTFLQFLPHGTFDTKCHIVRPPLKGKIALHKFLLWKTPFTNGHIMCFGLYNWPCPWTGPRSNIDNYFKAKLNKRKCIHSKINV